MDKKHSFCYDTGKFGRQTIIFTLVLCSFFLLFQLIPPEEVTYRVNGVVQPSTEETAQYMRSRTFPLVGGIAVLMLSSGVYFIWLGKKNEKLALRLKQDGMRLTAKFTGFENGNIAIKGQGTLKHLQCAFADGVGNTYVFKSFLLQKDPTPFLTNGELLVYHEPGNMKVYFVDVDGSVNIAGNNIIEK